MLIYVTIKRYLLKDTPMKSQTSEREEVIFYLTCHGIVILTMMVFGYSLFTLTSLAIQR